MGTSSEDKGKETAKELQPVQEADAAPIVQSAPMVVPVDAETVPLIQEAEVDDGANEMQDIPGPREIENMADLKKFLDEVLPKPNAEVPYEYAPNNDIVQLHRKCPWPTKPEYVWVSHFRFIVHPPLHSQSLCSLQQPRKLRGILPTPNIPHCSIADHQ